MYDIIFHIVCKQGQSTWHLPKIRNFNFPTDYIL